MAEPNVNFYKGNTNTINSVPITDGNILFDTDKRDISVDNETTRERFAGGNLSDTDIINDLTSTDTDKPLSANMGKELKDEIGNTSSLTTSSKAVVPAINELNNNLQSHKSSADHDGRYYTETEIDAKFSPLSNNYVRGGTITLNYDDATTLAGYIIFDKPVKNAVASINNVSGTAFRNCTGIIVNKNFASNPYRVNVYAVGSFVSDHVLSVDVIAMV